VFFSPDPHTTRHAVPFVMLALLCHIITKARHAAGRTGRIINILFLVLNGLLDLPVLYLSKSIIEQKNDYYRLLRQVTEKGLWEPWILFMLKAVKDTATFTRERTLAIRALMNETMEKAKEKLPARVYSKERSFASPIPRGNF
jgi:Fic family protein